MDTRDTQRLLDLIAEQSGDERIVEAVAELRRRGDVVVRRSDLRTVLRYVDSLEPTVLDALERLDDAVGRVP
jgi:hypothetical protein